MSLAPFDVDVVPETEELLKVAEEQLRETPEVREAAFKELKRLLHDNEDLQFDEDEVKLTIFLRACHWYPESAIKLVSPRNLEKKIPRNSRTP
jgi:retinaldehyde-binding protein 1